jgi:hypothetical protein
MAESSPRIRPSFAVDLDVADSVGEFDALLEVVTSAPNGLGEVAQVAQAFEQAANAGMFSTDPGTTPMPMATVSVTSPVETVVHYKWRTVGVQPGAFRVLLNMLEVTHQFYAPIVSVRLVTMNEYPRRLRLDGLLRLPFPGAAANPPFEIMLKRRLEDSKDPLIRLEFRTVISDDMIERLVPMFIAWDNVVIRGGYLNSLDDRWPDTNVEESLSEQQTYLAATDTVEHLFYEFIGAAAAYDGFINIAVRIHHSLRGLASFQVE